MSVVDEWQLFLEEHPEFFELSKSGFFISMLQSLVVEAKSPESIHNDFRFVEWSDLYLILEALVKSGVMEQIGIGGKYFFKTTEKGKLFLKMYKKTKRSFSV